MFTLADVLAAGEQPTTREAHSVSLRGAHYDSRKVGPGMLFVAMPGAQVDGNDFIDDAFTRGASAVLAERPDPTSNISRQVIVPSSIQVFQRLARHIRAQSSAEIIGVTGSNGKTSTKQALFAALSAHGSTLATDRSENTDVGVPTTLSRLHPDHQFAVIEMGAQIQGEISSYCQIADPNIAVITNLSAAHIGEFGSMENIVKAKSELIEGILNSGPTILPHSGPSIDHLRTLAPGRVVSFGREAEADVSVGLSRTSTGSTVTIEAGSHNSTIEAKGIAGPVDLAFGAAIAVTLALELPIEESVSGLRAFQPAPHRMALRSSASGIIVLDDSYNANTASMTEALRMLKELPVKGRKYAVLGDMLELGPTTHTEHRKIGHRAAAVDALFAIGQMADLFAQGAIQAGMSSHKIHVLATETLSSEDLGEARKQLKQLLDALVKPGDAILLKASNGIGLSEVSDAIAIGSDDQPTT